jgi:ABC-type phosphate/phosphonate transport system substrate-binding protein
MESKMRRNVSRMDRPAPADGSGGRPASKPVARPFSVHGFPGLAALILVAILPLSSTLAAASATSRPLEPARLNAGFIQSAFFGIHRLDAEAAFKTFARTIGRNMGYDIAVTVCTFENARELAAMPPEKQPDIVILESWSYLEMRDPDWLEPVFATSDQGKVAGRYLLLVRHDGDYSTLEDLRGASLNLYFAANAEPGRFWLEYLLREAGPGTPEEFFNPLELHADPMLAILPVFFGKKDAAVIDATKFELLAELNPQLGRLKILASSEPLVSGIICLKRTGWFTECFKRDMARAMAELHLQPAGQQILTLFRMDRLVPYESEHLDTMRQLHERSRFRENRSGDRR